MIHRKARPYLIVVMALLSSLALAADGALKVSAVPGKRIDGLELTTDALTATTVTVEDEDRNVVQIQGSLAKPENWKLLLDGKPVALGGATLSGARSFTLTVPLEGSETRFELVAAGPGRKRESQKFVVKMDFSAQVAAPPAEGERTGFFEKRAYARLSTSGFTNEGPNGTAATNLLVGFPGVGLDLRYWRGQWEDSPAWQFGLGGFVSRTEDIGTTAFPWVYALEGRVARRAMLGSAASVVVSPFLGAEEEVLTQAGVLDDLSTAPMRESVLWIKAGAELLWKWTSLGAEFEVTPAFLKSASVSVSTTESMSGWGGEVGLRASRGGHLFVQGEARYLKFSGDRSLKGNDLALGVGWKL